MASKDERRRRKERKREEKKRLKKSNKETSPEYSEKEMKQGKVQLYLVGLITIIASAFIFFNMN